MIPDSHAIEAIERRLGYDFKNKGLLLEALTHKSYYYEHKEISSGFNERLEFLGDSVLGLSVADELFGRSEGFDEAMMSKVKSYLVKGEVLSEVAIDLDIGQHLLLGKGEEESGGRSKRSLLANAVEAIIGAVHTDAGFENARQLVLRLLGQRLTMAIDEGLYKDFKSELQEASQEIYSILPDYRVAEEGGPEHEKSFLVEVYIRGDLFGSGRGRNKKEAQQAAARIALGRLRAG